jgi:hypothetical protein
MELLLSMNLNSILSWLVAVLDYLVSSQLVCVGIEAGLHRGGVGFGDNGISG